MDDVAGRLGVSKGTVYRSVGSKDALFAAGRLRARLSDRVAASGFASATRGTQPATDPAEFADEVMATTRELFDALAAYRVGVMVLDRCAAELPGAARSASSIRSGASQRARGMPSSSDSSTRRHACPLR